MILSTSLIVGKKRLTLKAALNSSVLIFRTHAFGGYEAPALITFNTHSANLWTKMLSGVNDYSINYWKTKRKKSENICKEKLSFYVFQPERSLKLLELY